uniref:FoP_duplication domain-containing protein n=1 Tax=Heterorhabditis bacteriophora TaxID=37862 RepID=A0A1I7XGW3_HETBA
MPPRGPFMRGGPPPPPMVNMQPQDQRFKNTWLDASFMQPFPMPFPPMAFPPMDPRFGVRGRGRGGQRIRGGFINGKRSDGRKDLDKKEDAEAENISAIDETTIEKDLAIDKA